MPCVVFSPIIRIGNNGEKKLENKKSLIFMPCDTLNHRHYQNWAHLDLHLTWALISGNAHSLRWYPIHSSFITSLPLIELN
jgi:hypothetical protein